MEPPCRRRPSRRPVAKSIAAQLGIAACQNALELTDEAALLRRHGRAARAFVLATLAAEELAKGWAALLAQTWGDEEVFWDVFWDVVRGHHTDKLRSTMFLERFLLPLAGHDPSELGQALADVESRDVFTTRLRAMYVDLEDDTVHGPDEIANDAEAQELGRKLTKMVVTWAIIIGGALENDAAPAGSDPSL